MDGQQRTDASPPAAHRTRTVIWAGAVMTAGGLTWLAAIVTVWLALDHHAPTIVAAALVGLAVSVTQIGTHLGMRAATGGDHTRIWEEIQRLREEIQRARTALGTFTQRTRTAQWQAYADAAADLGVLADDRATAVIPMQPGRRVR